MTSHDQLWKDLFRTFFPDLLFLVDADLADRLIGSLGLEGFTFLDKEVFHDLPEGERREVDLLAETPDPATGRKSRFHVEIERHFSGEIGGRRVARYDLPTIGWARCGGVRRAAPRPSKPGGRSDGNDMG